MTTQRQMERADKELEEAFYDWKDNIGMDGFRTEDVRLRRLKDAVVNERKLLRGWLR